MKRILFALTLFTCSVANAGLLVEPFVGFNIASGEDGANPKTEYDQSAPFYGARLGYQVMGLMAGLDYTKGMEAELEEKTGSNTSRADVDQQTMGIFVGYNLPVMLRAWVAYHFSSKLEYQNTAAVGDELKGKGYGLGVGFTPLPLVSLNLEYRMLTFDEYKNASTGTTTALSGVNEIDYNQIMFSVSVPLDL